MILDAFFRTSYDDCNKAITYSIIGATIFVILGWIIIIGYSKIETDVYDYFDSNIYESQCNDDDKIYWKQIEKYDNMSLLLSLRNWKFIEKSNIDYPEDSFVGLHDFSRPDFNIICAQIDIENNMRIIIRENILFYPERRIMICQAKDIKSLPTCRDNFGKALGNSFFFEDEYLTSFDPVDFLHQLSLRRYLFI